MSLYIINTCLNIQVTRIRKWSPRMRCLGYIFRQIILTSSIRNVRKTLRRICIFISGPKRSKYQEQVESTIGPLGNGTIENYYKLQWLFTPLLDSKIQDPFPPPPPLLPVLCHYFDVWTSCAIFSVKWVWITRKWRPEVWACIWQSLFQALPNDVSKCL